METIVALIDRVLMNIDDAATIEAVKKEVKDLMKGFPLYNV